MRNSLYSGLHKNKKYKQYDVFYTIHYARPFSCIFCVFYGIGPLLCFVHASPLVRRAVVPPTHQSLNPKFNTLVYH
jgi:hypothetical protein